MNKKHKIYTKIPTDAYAEDGSMDLDSCYETTVAELGLQQSKRDQIIAFYLTILGFVIPNVISLDISNLAKAVAFLSMYGIGAIFCHVILRYRIYKEVYWIACRVLTQLCNIKPEYRNRDTIYTLYYNCLVKNEKTIVIKNKGKKSFWLSFKRQINSAETLLYEVLVLFSTFVGGIGALYAYSVHYLLTAFIIVFLIAMVIVMNYKYTSRLMKLYACIDEKNNATNADTVSDEYVAAFESTFEKAWMLHCFVDDIKQDSVS